MSTRSQVPRLAAALTALWCRMLCSPDASAPAGRDRERGDVPGWVMITLMTAGLVAALWLVAGDRFEALFNQAIDAVTGRL